jgi:hypothetical protein
MYSFNHPRHFEDRDLRHGRDDAEALNLDARTRQERLLDAGLEETFPASDPVAVMRLT